MNNDNKENDREAMQDVLAEELSQPWRVDLFQQGGVKEQKKPAYTVSCLPRISDQSLKDKMCQLNTQQREFVMHILHCFRTNRLPLRIFLSGAALVGKSLVISCFYQLITKYFDDQPGDEKSSLVVLLCAPSGKAAFAIGGVTLHTALGLPLAQFGGVMPELSNDIANTIRTHIAHVKLLIIDEIYMVGQRCSAELTLVFTKSWD